MLYKNTTNKTQTFNTGNRGLHVLPYETVELLDGEESCHEIVHKVQRGHGHFVQIELVDEVVFPTEES